MDKPVRVRQFRDEDYRACREAGAKAIARARKSKSWVQHVDLFVCLSKLVNKELSSVIVEDTYLLLYHVGKPWYSDDLVLSELLCLKIYEGGATFDCIPQALLGLAKHHGATGVTAGTALAPRDKALTRLYSRHGFTPVAVELYKPTTE